MTDKAYSFPSLKAIADYFNTPLYECVICGNPGRVQWEYHKLGVCSECAKKVLKAYDESHGGKRP